VAAINHLALCARESLNSERAPVRILIAEDDPTTLLLLEGR